MARTIAPLSATAVKNKKYPLAEKEAAGKPLNPVFVAVGGVPGLLLQISQGGGKSWAYRYRLGTARRTMGLGPYDYAGRAGLTLEQARDAAAKARVAVRAGEDPLQTREQAKAKLIKEQKTAITFAELVTNWDEANPGEFSSEAHRERWLNSVRDLQPLQKKTINNIDDEAVWEALKPVIARGATDTANRTRQRVTTLFNWGKSERIFDGDNPGDTPWIMNRMKAKLKEVKTGHRPALQVQDAPRWMEDLRTRGGTGNRALEFLALTAARSGDVRGMEWSEVDLDRKVWSIPAERMKMKRAHEVPLSPTALALLAELPRDGDDLVFPAIRGGMLSDATLSAGMRRMHKADEHGFLDKDSGKPAVPHGLRSTFRVWAGQQGISRELAEHALAHSFGDSVEQAYQRDQYTEQRRPVMEAWAEFLSGAEADSKTVVKLNG